MVSRRPNKFLISLAAASFLSTHVIAAETLFAFTRGVDTLPKGQSEIAANIARLSGERLAPATALTFLAEYERGIGDDTSVSGGVGGYYLHTRDETFGTAPGGGAIVPARSEERLSVVTAGVQHRVLSPYTDGIGLALRVDATYEWLENSATGAKARQYGVQPSVIVQKNYLDDMLNVGATIAANFRHGCERPEDAAAAKVCRDEIEFRPSVGVAYRVAPRVNVGVESFYRQRFTQGRQTPGAYYIGPTFHYGDRRWYATATLFWQVAGATRYAPPMSLQYSPTAPRVENETEFRFRVGLNL